ncbi:hypothetical protein BWQ96_01005 [Gracilariopsis chorda]|uniref:SCP domain-containing protein n=1 Tax=Gracilariopsis chorda TaxID=448386 RepID=A0A2V3J431_9FLOR|nr:hypothetical protein BWQ96_01005 [Gracilariopsis chorda]|eukprot:PXF49216.1 hypothetical protein BWQ96_01005 [Gracilariopsis chorda]
MAYYPRQPEASEKTAGKRAVAYLNFMRNMKTLDKLWWHDNLYGYVQMINNEKKDGAPMQKLDGIITESHTLDGTDIDVVRDEVMSKWITARQECGEDNSMLFVEDYRYCAVGLLNDVQNRKVYVTIALCSRRHPLVS